MVAGVAGTFARLPRIEDVPRHDVAVAGIPFDAGVTYRPGARFGPSAIREASRLLRPYHPRLDVMPFRDQQVVDAGDLPCNPFDIAAASEEIEAAAYALIRDGARLVSLGGDHTVAYPLLRAMHRVHGPVALVHFDAHLDTWDTYFDAPLTHGTPFRRAAEEGLFLPGASAHVGIRGSLYDPDDLTADAALGFTVVHCADLEHLTVTDVVRRLRARIGDAPLYLSVDIDVLDPAHAPATGTPEAGGLTSRELLGIVRGMKGLNLVGADVVEVSPAYDHADITSVAAANLAYEFVSLCAKAPR
ncbi:agmatinase [Streptomyces sp. NPDC091377]|uniref:agmatinase n=1 Tax=Streptomyces sp. NPDC091377 TaxID=3365995 RepID=UPI0038131020